MSGLDQQPVPQGPRRRRAVALLALAAVSIVAGQGCYAPLHYRGVPACTLSDEFRTPSRTVGQPLNYASLTMPYHADYMLGPNDVLEVLVNRLYESEAMRPIRAQIMANGDVVLPLVGAVNVGGMNLAQAQVAISEAYGQGVIKDSRVNVTVVERSFTNVVVLGEVNKPGVYPLPKYEDDLAHALAIAGGLNENAGGMLEVHRRTSLLQAAEAAVQDAELEEVQEQEGPGVIILPAPVPRTLKSAEVSAVVPEVLPAGIEPGTRIIRIPLRGFSPDPVNPEDITLRHGDVVVIPKRTAEVFYVVGKLSTNNTVRFSLGVKERELGAALVLPPDREVDVVSAVAMAGYIDPIDSPTTVTVHRKLADGTPLLVTVDLIKARYDRRETILVQPEDIIYLNPDAAWWSRRTFNAIVASFFSFRLSYSIPNAPAGP